jgi:hypothetical protein
MKQVLEQKIRPKIRLAEIDRLIRRHRIIIPPLSRATLLKMCEDGTFETAGGEPTNLGWLVYEDSFVKWVDGLDAAQMKNAARGERRVGKRS